MAKIILLEDVNEKDIIKAVKDGKILIYPTDTIYGLGCDALNTDSILKIREMKDRDSEKPFSIIAPSKQWISQNFEVNPVYIQKLPGPFTFILKSKKSKIVSSHVAKDAQTLGVRIPDHPFTKMIQKAGKPFIATSVNLSGEKPITEISEVPKRILNQTDIIIDAGKLDGKPSTIIDLTSKIARIIPR
ncbi:threonylcarbamoyl-AMP synthase [Candidatus Woesearchaeota archaeon]|nr:threonylcarbamoyl-AMP synthase [Candidatus Woesearchaeota archaeon]